MWLVSGRISLREGKRWTTQKEEVRLAVRGSGKGVAIGRSQSPLRALSGGEVQPVLAPAKGFGLREGCTGSFTSLCTTPQQRHVATGNVPKAYRMLWSSSWLLRQKHQVLNDFFTSGFVLLGILICKSCYLHYNLLCLLLNWWGRVVYPHNSGDYKVCPTQLVIQSHDKE